MCRASVLESAASKEHPGSLLRDLYVPVEISRTTGFELSPANPQIHLRQILSVKAIIAGRGREARSMNEQGGAARQGGWSPVMVLDAVRAYVRRGWRVVPVPHG